MGCESDIKTKTNKKTKMLNRCVSISLKSDATHRISQSIPPRAPFMKQIAFPLCDYFVFGDKQLIERAQLYTVRSLTSLVAIFS